MAGFEIFHHTPIPQPESEDQRARGREAKWQAWRRAELVVEQLSSPTPEELVLHPERILWRCYWLHRGWLAAPFWRQLDPVPKVEVAACDLTSGAPSRPVRGVPKPRPEGCRPEEVPHPACRCGLRVADRLEALEETLRRMITEYDRVGSVLRKMKAEDATTDSFDYPTPVLVRCRAEWCLQHDPIPRVLDYAKSDRGRSLVAPHIDHSLITETGFGLYRARQLTIIGPVVCVPVPYAEPDLRDLAEQYGVEVFTAAQDQLANLVDLTERTAS